MEVQLSILKKVVTATFSVMKSFLLDLWKSLFSVALLLLSTFGLYSMLIVTSVPTYLIGFLSIIIVYALATIAPKWEVICC